MWGRNESKPASNLFALGPKDPHGFLLCKRCEQFLRLAPTLKKDASHSCLISLSWRQECCSGALLPSVKAYKAWVGRIFLRCGSKFQKLLTSLAKNESVWVLRPQRGKTACKLGFVPSPQKGTFEGDAHQRYCPLWVVVFETCSNHTVLLPRRAHLYHYNTTHDWYTIP